MTIKIGDSTSRDFSVDAASMKLFQTLSGDASRIHCDEYYARSRGYEGVIVYGGIMLAHLSNVLGMHLPGTHGISTSWSVNYRRPLYMGDNAKIRLEVTNVSSSTGVIEAAFRITVGERLIASGRTQSIVPLSDVCG